MPRATPYRIGLLLLAVAAAGLAWTIGQPSLPTLAQDRIPPEITEVKVESISPTSSIITWKTDKLADSLVNYGTTKQLGTAREPNPMLKEHGVVLTDLEPATTYYFRAVSADQTGNRNFSATYLFRTPGSKPIPDINKVADPEQRELTEKTVELIDDLRDRAALEIVADKISSVGASALSPPKILGEPTIEVEAERATILWETDKEANSIVEYASENDYQNGGYNRKDGDADELTLKHRVVLDGLRPLTTYHIQITSKAKVGPIGKSEDRTFSTKSILPQILSMRLIKVEEDSATITWSTQVPAAGLVEYTNLSTKEAKSLGDPSLQTSHTIRLPDLRFKNPYSVVVKARTPAGDEIPSQPLTFITTKDEVPPIIAQVNNESTLYPGADAKVQTIVSWETDELAVCQLFYGEGLTVGEEEAKSLPEETGALLRHVQVITEFTPSTVYKFWVACKDRNGNPGRSEDFALFTPEKEKNIIDIILENFQGTFGWVQNIGK